MKAEAADLTRLSISFRPCSRVAPHGDFDANRVYFAKDFQHLRLVRNVTSFLFKFEFCGRLVRR